MRYRYRIKYHLDVRLDMWVGELMYVDPEKNDLWRDEDVIVYSGGDIIVDLFAESEGSAVRASNKKAFDLIGDNRSVGVGK